MQAPRAICLGMGTCGGNCGITKEREREQKAALDAALRAYPGWVWRPVPAVPAMPLSFDALRALGASLEEILPVRALARAAEGTGCDWLYLLAGVHSPSLLEVMDGLADAPEAPRESETYVRLGLSPLGPFATLQEVRVSAGVAEGDLAIVEEPLVGVEDKRLQHIVKGLQGALRKAKLVVLDMAFLVEPAATADPQREYERAYGAAPLRWAFLFDPAPPTTSRASIVARPRSRARAAAVRAL
jgi:hypothetical protein